MGNKRVIRDVNSPCSSQDIRLRCHGISLTFQHWGVGILTQRGVVPAVDVTKRPASQSCHLFRAVAFFLHHASVINVLACACEISTHARFAGRVKLHGSPGEVLRREGREPRIDVGVHLTAALGAAQSFLLSNRVARGFLLGGQLGGRGALSGQLWACSFTKKRAFALIDRVPKLGPVAVNFRGRWIAAQDGTEQVRDGAAISIAPGHQVAVHVRVVVRLLHAARTDAAGWWDVDGGQIHDALALRAKTTTVVIRHVVSRQASALTKHGSAVVVVHHAGQALHVHLALSSAFLNALSDRLHQGVGDLAALNGLAVKTAERGHRAEAHGSHGAVGAQNAWRVTCKRFAQRRSCRGVHDLFCRCSGELGQCLAHGLLLACRANAGGGDVLVVKLLGLV